MRVRYVNRIALLVSTTMLSACSQVLFGIANAPSYFASVERIDDIAYGQEDRQRLDIYRPSGAHSAPVVIFWYGGSWTTGSKESYRFVGTALAEEGFVSVLPDYRLHPEVKFPAFMDDAASAVAWVQANIAQHGGDPTRIVLMGHSAGAHIAAYVANQPSLLMEAGARPDWIRGLVGLAGPYALDPNSATLKAIFAAPYSPAEWQPVRFVSDDSPPTLLIHGLADTVVHPSHTEKMYEALQQSNVDVAIERYKQANHTDPIASFSWLPRERAPAFARTVEFIREVTD